VLYLVFFLLSFLCFLLLYLLLIIVALTHDFLHVVLYNLYYCNSPLEKYCVQLLFYHTTFILCQLLSLLCASCVWTEPVFVPNDNSTTRSQSLKSLLTLLFLCLVAVIKLLYIQI